MSIHGDSVSDNSTAIMSVTPTCLVAEERGMLLTMREKTRIEAVQAVMDGRLTVDEAATAL